LFSVASSQTSYSPGDASDSDKSTDKGDTTTPEEGGENALDKAAGRLQCSRLLYVTQTSLLYTSVFRKVRELMFPTDVVAFRSVQ